MATKRTTSDTGYLTADKRFAVVEEKMQSCSYEKHGLVEVLITAQDTFGYLSPDLLNYIAKKLRVPLSQVLSLIHI